MTEKRVSPNVSGRDVEVEGGVTVMSDLIGPNLPEVEVDRVQTAQPRPNGPQMVIIRVNQDVENMSWVAENRTERYTFTAGNRYEVPWYIAAELEGLGRIWH